MIPIQNSAASSASTATSGVASASRRTSPQSAGNSGSVSAGPGAAGAEQVSISNAGQMLQMASTQGATPPASDARIAALQAAIQSGQYAVDPQRIASGLLQDSQSLLGASTSAGKATSN